MLDQNLLKQNIIKELGIESLSREKKAGLLQRMADIVQQRLTLNLMAKMSEQDQTNFEKNLNETPDKAQEFIQNMFPNLMEIIQEEIIKLKQELTNHLKENNTL